MVQTDLCWKTQDHLTPYSQAQDSTSFVGIIVLDFSTKWRQPDTKQNEKTTTKACSKSNLVTDLYVFLDGLDMADGVLYILCYLE